MSENTDVAEKRPSPSRSDLYLPSVPQATQISSIDLDITTACNLSCSYCFKSLGEPHHMSVDTAKTAIEWLIRASKNVPEISVNFMGGEPILRFEDLKEIVAWGRRRARAAGKRASFSLTSNMTLWTDEIRQWVDEQGLGVMMSTDGHPEMQDTQRPAKDGKPKAEIVAKWTRSMLSSRPNSHARLTLSPACVHRLYDSCVYLWEDIGFTEVMMADADYENWTDDHIRLFRKQLNAVVDYLVDNFRNGGERRVSVLAYFAAQLILPRAEGREVQRKLYACGAGYNYIMIDYEGTIWPCHRFDGAAKDSGVGHIISLGNIFTTPFNEALSNAFRSNDHSKVRKPECDDCPIDPICGGACPAANLQHNTGLYLPHPTYCLLKQLEYETSENLCRRLNDIDSDRCRELMESVLPENSGERRKAGLRAS